MLSRIIFIIIILTCLSAQCHQENDDFLIQTKQKDNFPIIETLENEECETPESWEYSGPKQVFLPLPAPFYAVDSTFLNYPSIAIRSAQFTYLNGNAVLLRETFKITLFIPYIAAYSILTFAAIDQLSLAPSEVLIENKRIRLTPKMISLIKAMLPNDNDRERWPLTPGVAQLSSFIYQRIPTSEKERKYFDYIVSYKDNKKNWSFDLLWNQDKTKMSIRMSIDNKKIDIGYHIPNRECAITISSRNNFTFKVKGNSESEGVTFLFIFNDSLLSGYADENKGYYLFKTDAGKPIHEGPLITNKREGVLQYDVGKFNSPAKKHYLDNPHAGSADELISF